MDKMAPYDLPIKLQVDLTDGAFEPYSDIYERRLSVVGGLFSNRQAVSQILVEGDPVLYDVRTRPFITSLSDLTFAITRIYPGKIGDEYYMTKGHFHLLLEQPEIYFCLQGDGCLLLESAEGDFQAHWWTPGSVSHIPPGYAHRMVNIGKTPLIFSAVFHLSAGHDYGQIAQYGFSKLVIEDQGIPVLVDNPHR